MTDYVIDLLLINTKVLVDYLNYKDLINWKKISKKYYKSINIILNEYNKKLGINNKKFKDIYMKSEVNLNEKTNENNKLKNYF